MKNITVKELEDFIQKAKFCFIYHEGQVIHNYFIDNLVTEVNNKFIDLYEKDEEFYIMRICKENITDIIIDDCDDLGWTIEIHMDDDSIITLEYLV